MDTPFLSAAGFWLGQRLLVAYVFPPGAAQERHYYSNARARPVAPGRDPPEPGSHGLPSSHTDERIWGVVLRRARFVGSASALSGSRS
jgi:hypothetical protein